ncbi:MAG: hypothetical protein ABI540_05520, partial [Spartobacteria bacterium]
MLITLGLFFLVTPLVEKVPRGDVIEALLLSFVFLFAVLAVGAGRRKFIIAALLMTPALVGKWFNHFRPDLFGPALYLIPALIFGSYVILQLQLSVMQARRVDTGILCTAICVYLFMGLVWSFAYLLEAGLHPGSFTSNSPGGPTAVLDGFTAFYFSFGTQSTAGFGDIT